MGTKNTTTTTNQYSPAGMTAYNALQAPATGALNSNITNPYGNAFFNQQKNAAGSAATTFGNARYNANAAAGTALGTSGGPGLNSAFNNYNTRGNAAISGAMNNSLLMGAANNRNASLSAAMNYRPLQTGGTQVQQTSGLGTWLPQVIGMGIGAATSAFGLPDPLKFSSPSSQASFGQWAGSGFGGAPSSPGSGGGATPTAPDLGDPNGTNAFGSFGSSPFGSF
jgi:hypothetical protein